MFQNVMMKTTDLVLFCERLEYYFNDYVKDGESSMVNFTKKPELEKAVREFVENNKYKLDKIETCGDDEVHYYITKTK